MFHEEQSPMISPRLKSNDHPTRSPCGYSKFPRETEGMFTNNNRISVIRNILQTHEKSLSALVKLDSSKLRLLGTGELLLRTTAKEISIKEGFGSGSAEGTR